MATPVELAAPPGERLDAVLAGEGGADAVAALAIPPLAGEAADLVRDVAGADPAAVRLVRTKFKPGRSLSAYYAAMGPTGGERHLALTWQRTPDAARVAPTAASADGKTAVFVAPDDSRLPGLARLAEPATLAVALAGLSADLAAPVDGVTVHTIRYRPGQRHVLRVDIAGAVRPRVYVKLDRDDSGLRAVRTAAALRPLLSAQRHHVGVVEAAGYLDEARAAVWNEVPGPTLSELLLGGSAPAPLLRRVGAALRALHDAGRELAPSMSEHDAAAEMRATVRAGEIVLGLEPSLGDRYAAVAGAVLEQLPATPANALTATHGDVKGDNLIIGHGRVVFLDLDRAARADPALDLGKLLADLRWRSGGTGAGDQLRMDALAVGYGRTDPSCWRRARLLAVLFQLKLAARRTLIHEPDWSGRIAASIGAAEQALRRERTAA